MILVTRPSPQGEALCAHLKAHHYTPLFFPVMEIKAIDDPLFHEQIAGLDQYDWALFVSRQAVAMSAPWIHKQWLKFPERVKVAAVGEGTAHALQQAQLPVDIYPAQWNSEGLLAMPELQTVSGKKIALFCGKGGRELLAITLRERGAEVIPLIAYERVLPEVDIIPYRELLQKQQITAMVCTSIQGVSNLKTLFTVPRRHCEERFLRRGNPAFDLTAKSKAGLPRPIATSQKALLAMTASRPRNDGVADDWTLLQKIPLVLVSERIMIQAKELGFKTCVLAKDASHDSILQALRMII